MSAMAYYNNNNIARQLISSLGQIFRILIIFEKESYLFIIIICDLYYCDTIVMLFKFLGEYISQPYPCPL